CDHRCWASSAGDLDADGIDDLFIRETSARGRIFLGRADWTGVSTVGDADIELDASLLGFAGVGDIDDDGIVDFAAVYASDTVLVWFGGGVWPSYLDTSNADVVLAGVAFLDAIRRDPYRAAPDRDGG